MSKISETLQKVKDVFLCYPLVLLMSFIMTSSVICKISESLTLRDFNQTRIIVTSSIGISLMFGLKMLVQRMGRSYLIYGLGILLLIGFYLFLPSKDKDFLPVHIYSIVVSGVLSHLLVAFAPYFRKGESEKLFWEYNKNLFINFFLTIVFTGVLTGGILLAISAVDNLFGVDISEKTYFYVLMSFLIFGSTFIFLLFNNKGLETLEKEDPYPIVLKFFTQFILIPLLLIYAVILYLYAAKILISWTLPQGWISFMILAYSIVGILALLLVHPLKNETSKSWVKIFSRVFYYTLIPLMILLFVAIFTRFTEYGFTEPRYFVLLLAVWLSCIVAYFVFVKNSTIKFIPVSLFFFGLLSVTIPYLNVFSVSVRSQKNQLENILNENNLLINGKIDFSKEVSYEIVDDIDSKFYYLKEHSQTAYLNQWLDEDTKSKLSETDYWYISSYFENKIGYANINTYKNITLKSNTNLFEIDGYKYAFVANLYDGGEIKVNNDILKIEQNLYNKKIFKIHLNSEESIDCSPLIEKLLEEYKTEGEFLRDDVFIEFDLGKYHIKIVFDFVSKTTYEETTNYNFLARVILIKEKLDE